MNKIELSLPVKSAPVKPLFLTWLCKDLLISDALPSRADSTEVDVGSPSLITNALTISSTTVWNGPRALTNPSLGDQRLSLSSCLSEFKLASSFCGKSNQCPNFKKIFYFTKLLKTTLLSYHLILRNMSAVNLSPTVSILGNVIILMLMNTFSGSAFTELTLPLTLSPLS